MELDKLPMRRKPAQLWSPADQVKGPPQITQSSDMKRSCFVLLMRIDVEIRGEERRREEMSYWGA